MKNNKLIWLTGLLFYFLSFKTVSASLNPYLLVNFDLPQRALKGTSIDGYLQIKTHYCIGLINIEWSDPNNVLVKKVSITEPPACNDLFPRCPIIADEPRNCSIHISSPIFEHLGRYKIWVSVWTVDKQIGLSTWHSINVDLCGNGKLDEEFEEQCDGSQFPEGVSCQTLGFEGGTLKCTPDCKFDTSECQRTTIEPSTSVLPNPLKFRSPKDLLNQIAHFLFILSLIMTPIIIITGGFLMTTGLPVYISLGQKIIKWAIIVFMVIAFLRLIIALF